MSFKHVPQVGRQAEPALLDARPENPQPAPTPLTPVLFTYDGLSTDVATLARQAVGDIRRLQRAAIVDIGRILIQVKDVLGHGKFGDWLDAEFAMGHRTATNYMAAAQFVEGKSETVSNLPPAALYALAAPAADETVVSAVLEEVEAGKVLSANEVRDRLNDATRFRKAAEREAKKTPEEIRKAKDAKKRSEAARKARDEKWQREEDERKAEQARAAMAAAAFLVEKLSGDDIATLLKLTKNVDFWAVKRIFVPPNAWGDVIAAATGESVLENFRAKAAEVAR